MHDNLDISAFPNGQERPPDFPPSFSTMHPPATPGTGTGNASDQHDKEPLREPYSAMRYPIRRWESQGRP
jgi:hypothetical protein